MSRRSLLAALFALGVCGTSSAADEAPWPDTVVTFEQLKARTGLVLKVPGLVTRRGVRGPAVLRAHLDSRGEVVKMALLESCGNPDLDESAMQALRVMKFEPFTLDGIPAEVTLVVPVHIPKRLGRSH